MDITLEQVEKLRARSDLGYEEARALLEQCNGSVLDALIELERRGRARPPQGGEGAWSSKGPSKEEARPGRKVVTVTGSTWENFWKDLCCLVGRGWELLRHCNAYRLQIDRRDRPLTYMPLWVLLVLLVVAFYVTAPLLALGLLLGCRYRIVKEG